MAGVLLATAGYDHTIRFWEAPTGHCYQTLQHPDSQVNQLQIAPDRQKLAAAGNPTLRLFDINAGPPSAVTTYDGHSSNVTSVGFEADGRWMYTASEDGTLKLWDLRAAGVQREFASGSPINSVALHPNQAELISGDRDGNIRVWDLGQNACSSELVPDGDKSIQSLSVARDASTLAAANVHGTVFLWRITHVTTGGGGGTLEPPGVKPAALPEPRSSPAVAPSSRIRIEPLQKLQAHASYIIRCIISPDCTRLATTSADHTVKIWDMTNNFACEETLTGHQRCASSPFLFSSSCFPVRFLAGGHHSAIPSLPERASASLNPRAPDLLSTTHLSFSPLATRLPLSASPRHVP